MKYQSRSGTRVREVEPYGITTHGRVTYFAGHDYYRPETRYLRIKKILWIDRTDDRFTIPPGFDIDNHLKK